VSEVGPASWLVELFDEEGWAKVDGLRPPAQVFICPAIAFIDGPIEVKHEGQPLLRIEPATGPQPGIHPVHLSAAIAEVIRAALPAHTYKPCADAAGYERRHTAAKEWMATQSVPTVGPLGRWKGRDIVSPWAVAALERLVGSFSLAPEHAAALLESLASAGTGGTNSQTMAKAITQGTWPADLDGENLDEEHRAAEAAQKKSDEARERNAKEAVRIVDVVVGDADIEGFRCPVGVMPPFAHLIGPGGPMIGPQVKPPSLVQGSWQYWLRRQIPGEPLPEITMPDGSGTIPRSTVLRLTKGALAGAVSGCWQDVFTVRAMRDQQGAVDRRAIEPSEMIGEGDPRCETVLTAAEKIVAQYPHALLDPMAAPHQRLHVVSALVRGLLLRPEVAAACIRRGMGVTEFRAPEKVPDIRMHSISNPDGMSWDHSDRGWDNMMLPRRLQPEPEAPVRDERANWVDEAVIAAAMGDTLWAVMSPGVLLDAVPAPTAAPTERQDKWEPKLRSALRGRGGEHLRSEEVCALVGADVQKTSDTSLVKKIMGKLGWTKREVVVDGERFRAYSRSAS